MTFSNTQHGVLRGIIVAATITATAIGGAIWMSPGVLLPADDIGSRLRYVLLCDVLLGFWLLISIGTLARHRFFSPEDIDGGGLAPGTAQAKIHQSILQNTLEQTVLAVIVFSACAFLFPIGWLASLPMATVLFAIGRILFWRGYKHGASARALGFGLTFYPTVLLFVLAVINFRFKT